MDFLTRFLGFCMLLSLIYTVSCTQTSKGCRFCKPGYYVSRQCTGSHDTVCKPCSKGTYSSVHNLYDTCNECARCGDGEFVLTACTRYSDTVCESCSAVSDIISDNFAKECLQNQKSGGIDKAVNLHDVMVQDGNGETPEGNVIYEGSGSIVVESKLEEVHVWPTVEGSGESVIDETVPNVTYAILPEGIDADGTNATTVRTVTIDLSGGIIELENGTSNENKEVLLSSKVPNASTTTIRAIIIEEGNGVDLSKELSDEDSKDVDVSLTNTERPRVGARKGESDDKGGSHIGVIVTVGLVAALCCSIRTFSIRNRL